MNRIPFALAALATLALPAAAPAQASGIQAGKWEIAVTINSISMEGAPPGIADMMKGKTTRIKQCITAEDAARGPQDLLKSGKGCTFTRYSMTGGKLNSEMVCKNSGTTTTAVSTGSFTPTGFTATGRSRTDGAMPTTMTSTSVGRRLGDC